MMTNLRETNLTRELQTERKKTMTSKSGSWSKRGIRCTQGRKRKERRES